MTAPLVTAFDAVSDGYSPDRVVADPEIDRRFIDECRARGLDAPPTVLNRSLLNLRKAGALSGRPPARKTTFLDEDEYRFAAEMAVRAIERRDGISLDDVICNPALAVELDKLAGEIAPGFSSLQYRWAALNLRKASKLKPELLARIAPPIEVIHCRVSDLDLMNVPTQQGCYLFFNTREILYIGEAENLRSRLKKHLDHSDNKGLARWMWDSGVDDLQIEMQVLKPETDARVRKAFELELIRSRCPLFNVKR